MHSEKAWNPRTWQNSYGRNKGYREEPRRPPGHSRVSSPIPAPAGLELIRAFLNTRTPKGDELRSARDLSDWLSRHGLLPAGIELTPSDLERARDARAGLRALLSANSGARLDDAVIARLDRAAVGARAQIRFDRDGGSRFEQLSRDLDDALGTVFGLVHVARCEGEWPAFKLCRAPDCRQAYFDYTKSRNGKWCTKRCGYKVKARAARRRAAK